MRLDTIFITDLLVRCVIGVNHEERRDRQDVIINIEIDVDARVPGASDRFEDAVDYRALTKSILAHAEKSEFHLVEAFAESIAALCLDTSGVEVARVRVEKPGALRFARSVGITITRTRG